MRILLCFGILLLFLACKRTEPSGALKILGSSGSENALVVPLRVEEAMGKTRLSELVDTSTLSVIRLETNGESIFGPNSHLKIYDGRIYVNEDKLKDILVFSETGKFLGKVNKVGRGAEEYMYCEDFVVKGDTIIILDLFRLMYYNKNDFSFIKSISIRSKGFSALKMGMDDSCFYFLTTDMSSIKSNLVICDHALQIKGAFRDPAYGTIPMYTSPTFFQMEGKMYNHHSFNDTLYHITPQGLNVEYVWDCGERAFNRGDYLKLPIQKNSTWSIRNIPKHYFHSLSDYVYADSILNFDGIYEDQTYRCFYSLITGKIRILNLKDMVDDIWEANARFFPCMSENGYFYSLFFPSVMAADKRTGTKGPFAGIAEDDNPVVLKFKYRKF